MSLKWMEKRWKLQDNLLNSIAVFLFFFFIIVTAANAFLIYYQNDGKFKRYQLITYNDPLANLQFVVGDAHCFLAEFCVIVLCKLFITGVVLAAIIAYTKAHRTIVKKLKAAQESERVQMTTRYEPPKLE